MFEEAKHFQLPEHPLARNKVLEDIGHLFEGDSLPVSGVCHRPRQRGKRQLASLALLQQRHRRGFPRGGGV